MAQEAGHSVQTSSSHSVMKDWPARLWHHCQWGGGRPYTTPTGSSEGVGLFDLL